MRYCFPLDVAMSAFEKDFAFPGPRAFSCLLPAGLDGHTNSK